MGGRELRALPLAVVLLLTSACIACYQPAGKSGKGGGEKAAAAPAPDQTIKGDANKRYFLIKPSGAAPAGGYKLLVVLPGGDGSADFNGFVSNMAKQCAPGYIVAQAVAPKWSKHEEIVWPTAKLRDPTMKFTTEEFIEAIVADVKSKEKVDDKHVFLLGWSSGGPPCYAEAVKAGSPVTGAFVAMSVFKPEQMPALEGAKGKAFYVYHSPQDGIPMKFAEAARDQLAGKGAKTTLVTYEGGHGWHGDIFGDIRKGITWLEGSAGK